MLKFQDKVALITGSGTGIGKAISEKFVENGASVIILGRRKEPLEEAAKSLKEIIAKVQSNAFVKIFSGVDVSDESAVTKMFDALKESNTNLDIVVNNAGVLVFLLATITRIRSGKLARIQRNNYAADR